VCKVYFDFLFINTLDDRSFIRKTILLAWVVYFQFEVSQLTME